DNLNKKLDLYDLDNTELKIRQETQDIKEEILNELGKQNKVLSDKDILINNLQKELKEFKTDYETIISEIEILFPDLGEVSIGRHLTNAPNDSSKYATVLLYNSEYKINSAESNKLKKWLTSKLNTSDILIVKK